MRLQTRLPAEFDPFFSAAAASSKPLTLERIMGSDQGPAGATGGTIGGDWIGGPW